MPSFWLTRMISAAKFDTCGKKGGNEVEDGMILGAGTGVFNLTSFSGLPTDSIIPSLDEAGVFFSFSYTTTFLASSITSSSSDTPPHPGLPPLPPIPLTHFSWHPLLYTIPMTHFPWPPPLPPLPIKDLSWSLTNILNFDVIFPLAIAFVLSGIELAQRCIFPFLLLWQWCFLRRSFSATASLRRDYFPIMAQT